MSAIELLQLVILLVGQGEQYRQEGRSFCDIMCFLQALDIIEIQEQISSVPELDPSGPWPQIGFWSDHCLWAKYALANVKIRARFSFLLMKRECWEAAYDETFSAIQTTLSLKENWYDCPLQLEEIMRLVVQQVQLYMIVLSYTIS